MERGRPCKHEALVLRDQYWAISLRNRSGQSYASLERELFPHVKVRKREDGEGYVQPFALSKVAAGTRGLAAGGHAIPAVVEHGEDRYPGSSQCYRSILWRALSSKRHQNLRPDDEGVGNEVRARLRHDHLNRLEGASQWQLTELGVRRVGRLTHIDALGLLLASSYPLAGPSVASLLAGDCISAVFARLCKVDLVLRALKHPLVDLIKSHAPHALRDFEASTVHTFKRRRITRLSVAMATLLRSA
jgi:hypothetical protein